MRRLGFLIVGLGDVRGARERDDALEHVDEASGERQIRPARVAGNVKEYDQTLAAPRAGHERRTVGKRRPRAFGQSRIRLRQDLTRHRHVVRHRHSAKGTLPRKACERLRFVPTQAAAEDAAAAPQFHRNEVVVGRGKPRSGKPHQHAAILDPLGEPIVHVPGDGADVGKNQHRQILVEEMPDRFGRRLALGEPHIGERTERAVEIVARRQQRLCGVGGRTGYDADGAAAPAFVEKLHGAGGALAGNLDPRDVVADFDR